MKKILFLYYSQTGQTLKSMQSFAKGLSKDVHCEYYLMTFEESFSFPWTFTGFFRMFPRCILGKTPRLLEIPLDFEKFDLIVLGSPIWFLSPALPFQSFLSSEKAKSLGGKKVIVLWTCRNLWYSSIKFVREKLKILNTELMGQFVLCEVSPLWASFVTTPRWMLTGNKDPFWFFPKAGLQENDYDIFKGVGDRIDKALRSGDFSGFSSQVIQSNLDRLSLKWMNAIGYQFFKIWGSIINSLAPREGRWQDLILVLFRVTLVLLILCVLPTTKAFEVIVKKTRIM